MRLSLYCKCVQYKDSSGKKRNTKTEEKICTVSLPQVAGNLGGGGGVYLIFPAIFDNKAILLFRTMNFLKN